MSRIRILPDEVANRIAAGEVIERPASVVKELMENAIDAGASRIVVQVQDGGHKLIQVSDNGCGMDREDALLCLEAHATSKVRAAEDLARISTLGFRGEALPSIASVSRFCLQTRTAEALAGVEVIGEGGTLREVRDCGCAPGTNVLVRQLFFNLPARRKFLRKSSTENLHIQETVLLQALACPGIDIECLIDGQQVYCVNGNYNLLARIAMLLGRDVGRALMPVDYSEAGIAVSGYVGRPGFTRTSRREQRIFVNNRAAVADTIYFGIRDAYHTLVMKGRYPPVVLYVSMDPELVDVNVHPAKREVRFRDQRLVGQVVGAAVRRALQELAVARRAAPLPAAQLVTPDAVQLDLPVPPAPAPASPAGAWNQAGSEPQQAPAAVPAATGLSPATTPLIPGGAAGHSPSSATREQIQSLRILGTMHDLYLVAEGADGLVLVDQHAAHERILFEQILAAAQRQDGQRQPLLLPVTVDLAPADLELVRRNMDHFIHFGFELEPFGGNTVLLTALPAHFPQHDPAALLRNILDDLRESPGQVLRQDEVKIAQTACKHAVKAEDPLSGLEIQRLLDDLAVCEMPFTCPHGRPVMITLPCAELEKRFGRRV